jgi:hypothetical protein
VQRSRGWKRRGPTPESVRASSQDDCFSFSFLPPLFPVICSLDATIAVSANLKVIEIVPFQRHRL